MIRLTMAIVVLGVCQLKADSPPTKINYPGVPYGAIFAEVEYAPMGINDVAPFTVYSINGRALAIPTRWNVIGKVEKGRQKVHGVLERGGCGPKGDMPPYFDSLRLRSESPPRKTPR